MADIPDLKSKAEEEKRKGGGLPPWANLGSPAESEGILASRPALLGSRFGTLPGWLQGPLGWVTSNAGMGIITILVVTGSVYGLYNLGMQSVQGTPQVRKAELFDHRRDPSDSEIAGPSKGANSVDYFRSANKGALGDGSGADQSAQNAQSNPTDSSQNQASAINANVQPDNANAPAKPDLASQRSAFMNRQLGLGNGLAGGSGLSGGMAQAFKPMAVDPNLAPTRSQQGKLLAMAGTSRASIGRSFGGGARGMSIKGAMGQLYNANNESGAAKKSSGETAAYHADQAFSGAPANAGGSIGGAGLGAGGAGGGAGVSAGSGEGGPIGGGTSSPTSSPSIGSGADVTPWTGMVMMGVSLLMVASMIVMLEGHLPHFLLGIKLLLKIMAVVLAAIATMLGIMIMTMYGQSQQGAILTTGGVITTAAATAALITAVPSWLLIVAGIAGIGASIMSQMVHH